MKYLVLALLLAAQTSPPVPRKAVGNPDHTNQNKQTDTQNDKTTATPPPAIDNPDNPGIPNKGNGSQAARDENKSIKVSVPPIDVNKDLGDYLSIISGLLLTLITFAIAIYAAVQAKAAKRSADNEERTVRLTQRADVLLKDFEMRPNSREKPIGRDTQFIVHFQNFGPTRASDVVFDFGMQVQGNKIPIGGGRPYVKPPLVPIVLGAGDDKNVTFNKLCDFFNDETIDRVADGRSLLSISGQIQYTDVFGVSYTVTCGGKFEAKLQTIVAYETIEERRKAQ